jgi:hypothetical protein
MAFGHLLVLSEERIAADLDLDRFESCASFPLRVKDVSDLSSMGQAVAEGG